MAEENKSAENIRDVPGNAGAENGAASENAETVKADERAEDLEDVGGSDPKKRKLRIALIVVLSILLVVAAGLLIWFLVDRAEEGILEDGIGSEKILYSAVEQGNIWENDEYIKAQKSLEVAGQMTIRYFDDEQSAKELFAELEKLPYGGEALGKYFAFLIEGINEKSAAGFAALFAPSFNRTVPTGFFPQKICNVYLRLLEYGEEGNAEWEVGFHIVNNDGWAVNYFASRDAGKARFTLTQTDGSWKIAKIATVYSGSTYS